MKHFTAILLLSLLTLTVNAEMKQVAFKLGPQLFRAGDAIELETVKATYT